MNKNKFTPRAYAFVCILILSALVLSACDPFAWPWLTRVEKAQVEATIAADALKATQIVAALTPGYAPTGATPMPGATSVAPSGIVGLTYDRNTPDCLNKANNPADPLVAGQTTYLAYYLCTAIEAGTTQDAVEKAIAEIQKEAAGVGANIWEGQSVTIPEWQAVLVWCSNASGVVTPNDVSYPIDEQHPAAGQVYELPPIGGGVNARSFSGCEAGFWAVAVR